MKRTASSIRVALTAARRQGTSRDFCRWAKRAGYTMPNTLSVEVPVALSVREWNQYDDEYGRDFDDALKDLAGIIGKGRNVGRGDESGTIEDTSQDRDGVKFFVEYPEGTDWRSAAPALEAALLKALKTKARDDDGLAALLFGLDGRERLDLDSDIEVWEG